LVGVTKKKKGGVRIGNVKDVPWENQINTFKTLGGDRAERRGACWSLKLTEGKKTVNAGHLLKL